VLLHPDPSARPTVAELLDGDMFKNAAHALRARHCMIETEEAALETQVRLLGLSVVVCTSKDGSILVQRGCLLLFALQRTRAFLS